MGRTKPMKIIGVHDNLKNRLRVIRTIAHIISLANPSVIVLGTYYRDILIKEYYRASYEGISSRRFTDSLQHFHGVPITWSSDKYTIDINP